jgi:gas vesicle protein
MDNGKIVLGVLAGLAAGAALGILFAPNKGTETRRKIGQKKDDLTDDLKHLWTGLTDKVEEKVEKVKNGVSDVMHSSKAH